MERSFRPWCLTDVAESTSEASPCVGWLWRSVAAAPNDVVDHVATGDLKLITAAVDDQPLFDAAASVIQKVPELATVVASRVRILHVLNADPGYDVSHSEPLWPDRIFVSLPERRDRIGAFRLAESIIHEAMHLHLTIFEDQRPLVRDTEGQTFSPWRGTHRPYGGVLHGLYVFASLWSFFQSCREEIGSEAAEHVAQRLVQISKDLADINLTALNRGLTDTGGQFAELMMAGACPTCCIAPTGDA